MIIVLSASVYTVMAQDTVFTGYCIIQGDNVSVLAKTTVKSRVITKLDKYEFVYCIDWAEEKDMVEDELNYWYRVRNCDGKEGWVYGKYVYYIDGTAEPGKYYKRMIEIEIVNEKFCNPEDTCKIYQLNNEHDHYIIDFESEQKPEYINYGQMGARWIAFYKIIDGTFTETIHDNRREYLFYKNYIILYTKKAIRIYNTKKFRERKGEPHLKIPYKYYAYTGFYLRNDVISNIPECNKDKDTRMNCISYSDMEFNRDKMEVTVNIRKEKDKLLKKERYKFNDGTFVKVE